jgi:hypothetical protein
MHNKKAYERHYFELLKLKIAVPEGEINFDGESPDVRVKCTHETLGVEVSRLFKQARGNQPPPQQEEAEQQLIVQSAQKIVEQTGVTSLMVSVHFGAYPLLRKSDRDCLSRQIAELVIDHAPAVDPFVGLDNDFCDLQRFPEKISAIHILRDSQLTSHHWQNGSGGWVDSSFCGDLQSRIDEKNLLYRDYLKECDRCWLIVAADWEGESSFYQFTEEMAQHEFVSEFERTFFIDGFTIEVHELRTSFRKQAAC